MATRTIIPWIPVYGDLPTHEKSILFEAHTSVRRGWTHVLELWLWCSRNRPDGNVSDLPAELLARVASWPKKPALFLDGLRRAGFLDDNGRLHDWGDYAGRYLEKREGAAERQRRKRARDAQPVTRDLTPPAPDGHASRGEERREDLERDVCPPPEPDREAGTHTPPINPIDAEALAYRDAYREHYGNPGAAFDIRGRTLTAFRAARATYPLATLLDSVRGLSGEPKFGRTLGLKATLHPANIEQGIQLARAPPRPSSSHQEIETALASGAHQRVGTRRGLRT